MAQPVRKMAQPEAVQRTPSSSHGRLDPLGRSLSSQPPPMARLPDVQRPAAGGEQTAGCVCGRHSLRRIGDDGVLAAGFCGDQITSSNKIGAKFRMGTWAVFERFTQRVITTAVMLSQTILSIIWILTQIQISHYGKEWGAVDDALAQDFSFKCYVQVFLQDFLFSFDVFYSLKVCFNHFLRAVFERFTQRVITTAVMLSQTILSIIWILTQGYHI
uniref:Uncharacterized protein n=1 Tax=Oryza punctata TaxID=4537 RepID=A0A0E0LRN3_ORYPU